MSRVFRWPLALVAAVVVARSAGLLFGCLNIDEVDFALVGRALAHGGLPYVAQADIKPPLTYVPFVLAGLGDGLHLWPVQLFAIALVVVTALVLARAAGTRWAAWLFVLATLCDVPSVNAELLACLPTALGLLWFVRGRSAVVTGVFFGLASLCKHQAAMPAVSLALWLLWNAGQTRSAAPVLRAVLLGVGALAPWLGVAALYAAAGHLHEFVDWTLVRNFGYAGHATGGSAWPRFLQSTATSAGVAIGVWICAVRGSRRGGPLVLALWLTWIPVSMGGRFYEHYYLQFAPLLALVAASYAESLPRWLYVLPALGGLGFFTAKGLAHAYPGQDATAREIAQFVDAHSTPQERMFVWGHFSPLHLLAQRMPGTKYVHAAVHVGNFDPQHVPDGFDYAPYASQRDVDETIRELEANHVALFVDLAPSRLHRWDRMPLSGVPALQQYVAAHYEEIGRPAGAVVLRRR